MRRGVRRRFASSLSPYWSDSGWPRVHWRWTVPSTLTSVRGSTSQRGPTWAAAKWRSKSLPRCSRAETSTPRRRRMRSLSGYSYSPPPHIARPVLDLGETSPSRTKGKRPSEVSSHTSPVTGFGVDVVVPDDAESEPGVPAPARPDGAEEALNVRDDRRGRVAGKDLLEMPAGQAVRALEKEGAGDFEVDAHQVGAAGRGWRGRRQWPCREGPRGSLVQRCAGPRRWPPCRSRTGVRCGTRPSDSSSAVGAAGVAGPAVSAPVAIGRMVSTAAAAMARNSTVLLRRV